jgi:hypothetical protein
VSISLQKPSKLGNLDLCRTQISLQYCLHREGHKVGGLSPQIILENENISEVIVVDKGEGDEDEDEQSDDGRHSYKYRVAYAESLSTGMPGTFIDCSRLVR